MSSIRSAVSLGAALAIFPIVCGAELPPPVPCSGITLGVCEIQKLLKGFK